MQGIFPICGGLQPPFFNLQPEGRSDTPGRGGIQRVIPAGDFRLPDLRVRPSRRGAAKPPPRRRSRHFRRCLRSSSGRRAAAAWKNELTNQSYCENIIHGKYVLYRIKTGKLRRAGSALKRRRCSILSACERKPRGGRDPPPAEGKNRIPASDPVRPALLWVAGWKASVEKTERREKGKGALRSIDLTLQRLYPVFGGIRRKRESPAADRSRR